MHSTCSRYILLTVPSTSVLGTVRRRKDFLRTCNVHALSGRESGVEDAKKKWMGWGWGGARGYLVSNCDKDLYLLRVG